MECEVCVDRIRLEHVLEFKSGTDEAECSRKVANGRMVGGAIRSLVNARILQLECARVLYESLLMPVLTYGSETMLWKEKQRCRVKAVQIENLKVLLGIRRMDKVPNARIRQLCEVTKRLVKVFYDGLAMWRQ